MNKKQVLLLVVTNLICIGAVSLFFTLGRSQQNNDSVTPQLPEKEPNLAAEVQAKPEQTIHADINSIITQYDIIKAGRYQQVMEAYSKAI